MLRQIPLNILVYLLNYSFIHYLHKVNFLSILHRSIMQEMFTTEVLVAKRWTNGVGTVKNLPPHSPVLRILSRQSLFPKATFTMSIHFGLPFLLVPSTSILITLFTTDSSPRLMTHTYHFKLLSCSFFVISPTFTVPFILSFLILSSLVTPHIHLKILISATSNFFCVLFAARVSAPYIIAGRGRVGKGVGHLGHVWSYGVREVVSSNPGRGNIVGWVFHPTRWLERVLHLNMPFLPKSEFI